MFTNKGVRVKLKVIKGNIKKSNIFRNYKVIYDILKGHPFDIKDLSLEDGLASD